MKQKFKDIIKIGHRGTRTKIDENTINAFDKAIKSGADYIEFDVRKTKDGKLIIIHDPTLDRTTTGSGLVKDFNYDEIQKLKTKSKKEQIPLLTAVLDKFKGNTKFMVDLKEENISKQVLKLVNERDLLKDCVISGRNLKDLKLIKKLVPNCNICYNITKGKDLTIQQFITFNQHEVRFNIEMISLRSNLMSNRFIEICKKNNILSLSWDFLRYDKPLEEIKSLIKQGINGILFDDYKNIPIIKQWLELN